MLSLETELKPRPFPQMRHCVDGEVDACTRPLHRMDAVGREAIGAAIEAQLRCVGGVEERRAPPDLGIDAAQRDLLTLDAGGGDLDRGAGEGGGGAAGAVKVLQPGSDRLVAVDAGVPVKRQRLGAEGRLAELIAEPRPPAVEITIGAEIPARFQHVPDTEAEIALAVVAVVEPRADVAEDERVAVLVERHEEIALAEIAPRADLALEIDEGSPLCRRIGRHRRGLGKRGRNTEGECREGR